MKNRILPVILLVSAMLFSSISHSQTVGMDFNQADCSGVNHNLFADLDNGQVVIITYIELGCSSCIVATSGIKTLLPAFEASDPGRVELFSFGYSDSYSCSEMLSWKNSNGYTHPVFSGGGDQTNYYGGMGMPTVVVLGGPEHTVLYKQLGYATSDKPLIAAAITAGLALSSGIDDGLKENGIRVFPTMATDHISLSFEKPLSVDIMLYDMLGKVVFKADNVNTDRYQLDVASLPKGAYTLSITGHGLLLGRIRIVKQ